MRGLHKYNTSLYHLMVTICINDNWRDHYLYSGTHFRPRSLGCMLRWQHKQVVLNWTLTLSNTKIIAPFGTMAGKCVPSSIFFKAHLTLYLSVGESSVSCCSLQSPRSTGFKFKVFGMMSTSEVEQLDSCCLM